MGWISSWMARAASSINSGVRCRPSQQIFGSNRAERERSDAGEDHPYVFNRVVITESNSARQQSF